MERTIKAFPTSYVPITVKKFLPKLFRNAVTIKDTAAIKRATQSILIKSGWATSGSKATCSSLISLLPYPENLENR